MSDAVAILEMARNVVEALSPLATAAATAAAVESGKAVAKASGEAAGTLWTRIRSALSRRKASAALERFEEAPQDLGRRGALEFAVEQALEADPSLRAEVLGLLDRCGPRTVVSTQSIEQTGSAGAAAQIQGNGNQVSIQRGDSERR